MKWFYILQISLNGRYNRGTYMSSSDSISLHYCQTNDPSQYKWVCPVCQARFKWDIQLMRHQIKFAHYNPDRDYRRQNRGRKQTKQTQFPCQFCGEYHATKIQLLNHRPWCLKDPQHGNRAKSYASSWNHFTFQCLIHDIPYYYSNLKLLQRHVSTHKHKTSQATKNDQALIKKKKSNNQLVQQLARQFEKYRKLNEQQAERIARAKNLSVSTIRRHFKKYQQHDLYEN